jgi:hypothetical protein
VETIEALILQARRDTDNEDFSDTTGIPDASFLAWANRAQSHIQAKILNTYPKAFQAEVEVQAVAADEEIALPAYLFLGARIEKVEFSATGNAVDYYELHLANDHMRRGLEAGQPVWYIRQSSRMIAMPPPSNAVGKFRITFQKAVPKLDKIRGTVASVTLASTLTALSLELDDNLTDENVDALEDAKYLTVIDEMGAILMEGIRITDVDVDTGVVTLYSGAHTPVSGETLPVGALVVAGKRSTNVSTLPETCEDFLAVYLEWRAFKKDSSESAAEAAAELTNIEERILESFSQDEPNVLGIPILDDQYLGPEG